MEISKTEISVLDVAAYCLTQLGGLEAMKLQKLVYYSQAWHLAVLQTPLFLQDFQAWAYGPVCYELYQHHRGQFVVTSIPGQVERLTQKHESKLLVDATFDHYKAFSYVKLSDMTHSEDPWKDARQVPDGQPDQTIISQSSIEEFYKRQRRPFRLAADVDVI